MCTDAAMLARGDVAKPATMSLAESVAAVAPIGPVLVVADNDAIGRCGPIWAHEFAAVGRPHRVRLCDPDLADPRAVVVVLEEAVSLRAVVIVGAGDGGVVEVARRGAAEGRLPFVAAAACSAE